MNLVTSAITGSPRRTNGGDGIVRNAITGNPISRGMGGGVNDYTTFEVLANNIDLPQGTKSYMGCPLAVGDEGIAEAIPAGMTHAINFKTLGTRDIVVDWGDGESDELPLTEISPDGSWEVGHTYAKPGLYTVRAYGGFARIKTVTDKNLLYRCCGFDQCFAAEHVNLQNFASGALRLVEVKFNDQVQFNRFTNFNYLFAGCKNLRKVTGMSRFCFVVSCKGIFQDCTALKSTDYRLPSLCALNGDVVGGDGYGYTFAGCLALDMNIENLFPWGGFSPRKIDVNAIFYRRTTGSPSDVFESLGGTVPAWCLWEDTSKIFVRFAEFGKYLNPALKAQIPVAWGGTKNISINPDTGTVY